MDLQSKRCGCGAVFRLATLMSRETRCHGCQRKQAEAAMEARKGEVAPAVDAKFLRSGIFVPQRAADRDACASGVTKPVQQPLTPGTTLVNRVTGDRLRVEADPGTWTGTRLVWDERPAADEVVWRDVGGQDASWCSKWVAGAMGATMPDGHTLVAYPCLGVNGWSIWKDGEMVHDGRHQPTHEAARAAAIAKWRELQPRTVPSTGVIVARDGTRTPVAAGDKVSAGRDGAVKVEAMVPFDLNERAYEAMMADRYLAKALAKVTRKPGEWVLSWAKRAGVDLSVYGGDKWPYDVD